MKHVVLCMLFLLLPATLFSQQIPESACVVVSPDKMNVFYRGVENPVSVFVAGVPEGAVAIDVSNGTFRRRGDGYVVRPGKGSRCQVRVYMRVDNNRQLMDSKTFRVKPVPDPVARVRGVKGKRVSRMDLVRSKGIAVRMPEWFDFDLKFQVVSFKVLTVTGGYVTEKSVRGGNFSSMQRNLLKRIKRDGKLFIEDIKVRGPDGSVRVINDIILTVR